MASFPQCVSPSLRDRENKDSIAASYWCSTCNQSLGIKHSLHPAIPILIRSRISLLFSDHCKQLLRLNLGTPDTLFYQISLVCLTKILTEEYVETMCFFLSSWRVSSASNTTQREIWIVILHQYDVKKTCFLWTFFYEYWNTLTSIFTIK